MRVSPGIAVFGPSRLSAVAAERQARGELHELPRPVHKVGAERMTMGNSGLASRRSRR